ncbi:MBL fold metallo-hydrolase [Robertmurraya massiliosenegalensis]|uniref:MBL fold metallo-hydrolase n=1 Tax=Robertmurraya TaxID=2837507 RepID=UPI0039A551C3
MKLTIIGFWGGYPKVNEASTGYLLEHDGFKLLIDCGSGVLAKLQNFIEPEELDAVLISHYHADHIADIGVLQHARLIKGFLGEKPATLPIYGHQFDEPEFNKLTHTGVTEGIVYDPQKTLNVGPFKVQFLRTNHPVPCFAMRIEADGKTLVYTADTSYKNEFISFSEDADLLLAECNFFKEQDGKNAGHMNSIDVGNLAKAANVKQVMLTHLPQYGELTNLVTEAGEIYSGPVSLAEFGKMVTI